LGVELAGRVAVVTGGSGGLGRSIVERLVAEGCMVVAADVEPGALAAREDESAVFCRTDVRVGADVERMLAFAVDRFGGLDLLVNNAGGVSRGKQWPSASALEWRATMELNLLGPMLATQLALEPMRARGGGAVVNIASSAGVEWTPYSSPEYGAAKAGLVRFTTCVGDLPGARVNCIVPGWIGLPRAHEELAAMGPAERAAAPPFVEPAAIAQTVVWLLRSDSMSGCVVEMPGGSERRILGTGNEER
jgi:NAD(P)-dependent dehydrogenase (short-subunit alcohol dehydrogenase family)